MDEQDRTRHVLQRAARTWGRRPSRSIERAASMNARTTSGSSRRSGRGRPTTGRHRRGSIAGPLRARGGWAYQLIGVHLPYPPRHRRFAEPGRRVDTERGQHQRCGTAPSLHGNTLFVSTMPSTEEGSTAACRIEVAPPIEFPQRTTRGAPTQPGTSESNSSLIHQSGPSPGQRGGTEVGQVERDHAPPGRRGPPPPGPRRGGRRRARARARKPYRGVRPSFGTPPVRRDRPI